MDGPLPGPILLFGGTTEGRELALWAASRGLSVLVSVAEDYGRQVMPEHPMIRLRQGRLDREGMEALLRRETPAVTVDATHPFARLVSRELRGACGACGVPYLRLQRDTRPAALPEGAGIRRFATLEEAAEHLSRREGGIFVATGSKELSRLIGCLGGPERLTVRVLPSTEALSACREAGLLGRQIIAMQGPFSEELNLAMFRASGARYLLTKESGAVGGFPEKVRAAVALGMEICVLADVPAEDGADVGALGPAELKEALCRLLGLYPGGRELVLVGAGPGDPGLLTREAEAALRGADAVFGAARVLGQLADKGALPGGAARIPCYGAEEVYGWLEAHPACEHPVVLFSGDVGVYSGAEGFYRAEREAYALRVLPGISSAQLFAAKLRIPLNGLPMASRHGREEDYLGLLRRDGRCLLFVSGASALGAVGEELSRAAREGGLPEVRIAVGRDLSLPTELVERELTARELGERAWAPGRYLLYLAAVPSPDLRARLQTQDQDGIKDPCGPDAQAMCEGVEDAARGAKEGILSDSFEVAQSRDGLPRSEIGGRLECANRCAPGAAAPSVTEPLQTMTEPSRYPTCGAPSSGGAGEAPGACSGRDLAPLPDEAFCRESGIPMTKESIRALALRRLALSDGDVLYDIGAGTGSVTIEAARRMPHGRVVAIERREEAIPILTANAARLAPGNVTILRGEAAEVLEARRREDRTKPTHVFIGGSGGSLEQILRTLLDWCPGLSVVMTAVTSETCAEVQRLAAALSLREVRQSLIAVTELAERGRYHLMRAQDPVWLISFRGGGEVW